MATILFDPIAAPGHINGSLQLARLLKQAGHQIVYIGPSEFKAKIKQAGFNFVIFEPFTVDSSGKQKETLQKWIECFISFFTGYRLKKMMEMMEEINDIIEKVDPDLILLDANFIQKLAIYGKYKNKIVFFETMVSEHYAPNIPPYNSTFIPKNNYFTKKYVDFLWFRRELYLRYRTIKARLIFFNNDFHSIYRKLALEQGIELEKWKDAKRMNQTKVIPKNVIELIIPPLAFDFPRPPKPNVIHIGPLINMNRDNQILDGRYMEVIHHIKDLKQKNKNTVFIYASLGTMSEVSPTREKKFINVLLKYCKSNRNHYIVFSVGNNYDIHKLPDVPENLHIFNTIPQLDILKHCDLMITHGGMNTLTECILNKVPVIVYPLAKNWDQNGNAARVAYHGIGIRGSFKRISVKNLKRNIEKILTDYNYYQANLISMNEKMDIEKASKRCVKIVESLIKINV